ncbi:MAG: hypothetical protein ABEJ02_01405 [Candidatus Paceibacteria bacterium]
MDSNIETGHNPEREKLLPSEDLKQIYEQLDFYSNREGKEEKLRQKKEMVEKIRSSEAFSQLESTLQENPMLYIGSGSDIELPLLLGAREVAMVERKEIIDEIKSKLEDLGKDFDTTEKSDYIEIEFSFDFGDGEEEVQFKIYENEIYGSEDLVKDQKKQIQELQNKLKGDHDLTSRVNQIDRFETTEEFGAILTYSLVGQQIDHDSQMFSKLKDGGYIISDRKDNLTRTTEKDFEPVTEEDFLFTKKPSSEQG